MKVDTHNIYFLDSVCLRFVCCCCYVVVVVVVVATIDLGNHSFIIYHWYWDPSAVDVGIGGWCGRGGSRERGVMVSVSVKENE